MEIGPRSGGNFVSQLIKYATGYNMISATLDSIMGNPTILESYQRNFSANYVIHSGKKGVLEKLIIRDELKPFIEEFHKYI